MEELKEGMYVRSKYGIDKVTETNTCCSIDGKEVVYIERKDDDIWGFMLKIEDIIKMSYNIIDLIEDKGIAEWNFKSDEKNTHISMIEADGCEKFTWFLDSIVDLSEIDIVKILTHEQFESRSYRVV